MKYCLFDSQREKRPSDRHAEMSSPLSNLGNDSAT